MRLGGTPSSTHRSRALRMSCRGELLSGVACGSDCPNEALPKKACTDAPGVAGPVIHSGQEAPSPAALVKYPGKIACPVRGLCGPDMILRTAVTCGGVRQLGPSAPAGHARLAGSKRQ